MASSAVTSAAAARFSYSPSAYALKSKQQRNFPLGNRTAALVVRAEGGINPSVRKEEQKVVDNVQLSELSKPVTPYCRCWRSGTFPLCDGSHVKHNKETGDNVGPLLLKK